MVREEFVTALHIEPSCWRAAGGFSCQTQRYGLDDGISNQELLLDLNLAGVRSPVFLDGAGEKLLTDHHDRGARGRACFPSPLNTGRGEIDCARIAPARDHAVAHLASDLVAPRQIDPECEIAKIS